MRNEDVIDDHDDDENVDEKPVHINDLTKRGQDLGGVTQNVDAHNCD